MKRIAVLLLVLVALVVTGCAIEPAAIGPVADDGADADALVATPPRHGNAIARGTLPEPTNASVDAFPVASAILDRRDGRMLTITIADTRVTCEEMGRSYLNIPRGAHAIVLRLWHFEPIMPGSYPLEDFVTTARLYERRPTCATLPTADATSGHIDLQIVTETSVYGSFDIVVDGAPIHGTFGVVACDDRGDPTCK